MYFERISNTFFVILYYIFNNIWKKNISYIFSSFSYLIKISWKNIKHFKNLTWNMQKKAIQTPNSYQTTTIKLNFPPLFHHRIRKYSLHQHNNKPHYFHTHTRAIKLYDNVRTCRGCKARPAFSAAIVFPFFPNFPTDLWSAAIWKSDFSFRQLFSHRNAIRFHE